jgi:hypothetical protein
MSMVGSIWKDGRLSWGVIAVVVFLTLTVLAFDLAWRVVKIQFDTLVLYAVAVDAAAAVALAVVIHLILRSRRRRV